MSTLAILPVKSFGAAKQRLGDALGQDDRDTLARAMLEDVLAALALVSALDGVVVVTANPLVEERDGVTVLRDESEAGQSAAALMGVAHALDHGADRVLMVPGDAPLLDEAELTTLLGADTPPVVIVPDRHGEGTNGLLLSPPDAIEPGFGPGSCKRHQQRARAAGHRFAVRPLPSLVLDVDTPEDLRAAMAALEGDAGRAPATRAALSALPV